MTVSSPGGLPERSAASPGLEMHGESHESAAFTQIGQLNNIEPLPPSPLEVRYSLPPDTAAFTGRKAELRRIAARVSRAAVAGGVVAIHAIGGMPGIGKTALAAHAAHMLRDQFPDRQLFIDLHAHTPGQAPMPPEVALAGLLAAVGVDVRYLPADLEGRMALWRDRMAGQRALLVLDNAATSSQVVPLLPGCEGCLVLITSRRHLGDLPGPVIPVSLDALPPKQAQAMFVRLAPNAASISAERLKELLGLTGHLPLAISLLARVYATHPSWALADLTAETKASLLTLTAEKDSVAAAFDVSYDHLSQELQQFFRCLGLHPGTVIDAYAAAALVDIPLEDARRHLDTLHGEGLLIETAYRRYGMHDLIRRYSQDRATSDRDQRLERLLDYYQHTAALAEALLAHQSRTKATPGTSTAPPTAVPDLPDSASALSWARMERANLLACLDFANASGRHARVLALTAAIAALLWHDGPWSDAITRHVTAVQSARHLGARLSQANALTDLGSVRMLTGDYPDGTQILQEALDIYRDLGDELGQANVLTELAVVPKLTGDFQGAATALEQALGIYRDLGDRLGQANALTELAVVRMLIGDFRNVATTLDEALGIYRGLGDRLGEANALTCLGNARRLTHDTEGAVEAFGAALRVSRDLGERRVEAVAISSMGLVQQEAQDYRGASEAQTTALRISRAIGDRLMEAITLIHLGTVRRLTGHYQSATDALEAALAISSDIGDRLEQANALAELGAVRRLTGHYQSAADALKAALRTYHDISDREGESHALAELGAVRRLTGHYQSATDALEAALAISSDIGDRLEQANALAELGAVRRLTGHYQSAADVLEAALRIYHDIEDRGGESEVLNEMGALGRARGDLDQARVWHQRALVMAREIASRWDEAHALAGLGRCALSDGHPAEGKANLRRAQEIFQRIGAAEGAQLAAELSAYGVV